MNSLEASLSTLSHAGRRQAVWKGVSPCANTSSTKTVSFTGLLSPSLAVPQTAPYHSFYWSPPRTILASWQPRQPLVNKLFKKQNKTQGKGNPPLPPSFPPSATWDVKTQTCVPGAHCSLGKWTFSWCALGLQDVDGIHYKNFTFWTFYTDTRGISHPKCDNLKLFHNM